MKDSAGPLQLLKRISFYYSSFSFSTYFFSSRNNKHVDIVFTRSKYAGKVPEDGKPCEICGDTLEESEEFYDDEENEEEDEGFYVPEHRRTKKFRSDSDE